MSPVRPRRWIHAIAALLFIAFATPAAHAQWQVQDKDAEGTLNNIKSDTGDIKTGVDNVNKVLGTTSDANGTPINGTLNSINNKFVIGAYDSDVPGTRTADPVQALPADSTVLDDGSHCNDVTPAQQGNCQKIVALENAQYRYMLTMYATSKARDDTLRKLLNERQQINTSDANQYGKLEDNTNKLTALYNLIAIDQQQMQSVNYAYEANLRYLRAQQTQMANAAASGKSASSGPSISLPGLGTDINVGSVVGALTTGVALKAALNGIASTPPSGMQTLSIEKTNGW